MICGLNWMNEFRTDFTKLLKYLKFWYKIQIYCNNKPFNVLEMGFGGSQGLFRAAPKSGSGPSKMVQSIFKPELVHPEDPLPELGAVITKAHFQKNFDNSVGICSLWILLFPTNFIEFAQPTSPSWATVTSMTLVR